MEYILKSVIEDNSAIQFDIRYFKHQDFTNKTFPGIINIKLNNSV